MRKLFLSVLVVAIALFMLSYNATGKSEIEQIDNEIELQVYNFDAYFNYLKEIEVKNIEKEKNIEVLSVKYEIYEITAYTANFESTRKRKHHPQYGITASGVKVAENHTIACPRSMEFGTEIYIPYFDNVFTCEDRGGAITDGRIDVYIEDLDEALEFGRQDLEVQIIEKGNDTE